MDGAVEFHGRRLLFDFFLEHRRPGPGVDLGIRRLRQVLAESREVHRPLEAIASLHQVSEHFGFWPCAIQQQRPCIGIETAGE
ncbi:hypothetical protein D3C86_1359670 [compost metagenome]